MFIQRQLILLRNNGFRQQFAGFRQDFLLLSCVTSGSKCDGNVYQQHMCKLTAMSYNLIFHYLLLQTQRQKSSARNNMLTNAKKVKQSFYVSKRLVFISQNKVLSYLNVQQFRLYLKNNSLMSRMNSNKFNCLQDQILSQKFQDILAQQTYLFQYHITA